MTFINKFSMEEERYIIDANSTFLKRFKTAYKYFLNEYIPLHSIMYGFIPFFILSAVVGSEQASVSIKVVIGVISFISILTYTTAFFNALLSFKYLSGKATKKIAKENFKKELVSEETLEYFKDDFCEKEIKNYFREDLNKYKTTNADIKRYISGKDNMRIISEEELKVFISQYSKFEVERMRRENPHHFITNSDLQVMKKNSEKYVFDNPMYNV